MDRLMCILGFLRLVACMPDNPYVVYLDHETFQGAVSHCKLMGFLANMPTREEVTKILTAISNRDSSEKKFWVGLKKEKSSCVQTHLPLKGFQWIVDNSTEAAVNFTVAKPSCIHSLCGLLHVEKTGNSISNWELQDSPCSHRHPFICKQMEGGPDKTPCGKFYISGTHDKLQILHDPLKQNITCSHGDSFILTCSPRSHQWVLMGTQDTDISELCSPCKKGFKKDNLGKCIDIDECQQGKPCKHSCVNTVGSYKCECPDDDADACKESTDITNKDQATTTGNLLSLPSSSPEQVEIKDKQVDYSYIFIPVLIAVISLVVLVAVIVVIVKCCLRKRSKNLANKKTEASKESVALNRTDSMERVNEKEAL
ncbi:C-type lectin domain family 14 member A [Chanos chanos]|uniref:C-type lectin domain family 14 member A n=1 Tax=Chanos chanos TaxID=29144 RepID=A0A6J2W548_CHACN|nr:complement component C1q receptor-like [Chanos chanos]